MCWDFSKFFGPTVTVCVSIIQPVCLSFSTHTHTHIYIYIIFLYCKKNAVLHIRTETLTFFHEIDLLSHSCIWWYWETPRKHNERYKNKYLLFRLQTWLIVSGCAAAEIQCDQRQCSTKPSWMPLKMAALPGCRGTHQWGNYSGGWVGHGLSQSGNQGTLVGDGLYFFHSSIFLRKISSTISVFSKLLSVIAGLVWRHRFYWQIIVSPWKRNAEVLLKPVKLGKKW